MDLQADFLPDSAVPLPRFPLPPWKLDGAGYGIFQYDLSVLVPPVGPLRVLCLSAGTNTSKPLSSGGQFVLLRLGRT